MKRFLGILLILFICISSLFIGYNLKSLQIQGLFKDVLEGQEHHSPPSVVIEPGSAVETASYIIFQDDEGFVYAKSGDTGEIEFSGIGMDESINWALDNLRSGGSIYIRNGVYSLDGSTQVDTCDSGWADGSGGDVTVSLNAVHKKEGSASTMLEVADSAGTELLAYHDVSTVSWNDAFYVTFWFYSTVQINDGDLQFILDDTNGCKSPLEQIDWNMPKYPGYMPANTWCLIRLPLSDARNKAASITRYPINLGSIVSIGIYQAVDKGAYTIYIDDVQKQVSGLPILDKDNITLVFENGAVLKRADGHYDSLLHVINCDNFNIDGKLTVNGTRYELDGGGTAAGTEMGEQFNAVYLYRCNNFDLEGIYGYQNWGDVVGIRESHEGKVSVFGFDNHHPVVHASAADHIYANVYAEQVDIDGAIWIQTQCENWVIDLVANDCDASALRVDSGNTHIEARVSQYDTYRTKIDGDYCDVTVVSRDVVESGGLDTHVSGSGSFNRIKLTAKQSSWSGVFYGIYYTGSDSEIDVNIHGTGQAVFISGHRNDITGKIVDANVKGFRLLGQNNYLHDFSVSCLTAEVNFAVEVDSNGDFTYIEGGYIDCSGAQGMYLDGHNGTVKDVYFYAIDQAIQFDGNYWFCDGNDFRGCSDDVIDNSGTTIFGNNLWKDGSYSTTPP